MANGIMLALSMLTGLGTSVGKKFYVNKTTDSSSGFVYNAVTCFAAAVVLFCWGGWGTSSAYTLVLGFVFGCITALLGVTNFAALSCGPMSYTSVIVYLSAIIPALSGVMFFDESLAWAQIVGIVLMVVSFVLAVRNDGTDDKKINWKWLVLCFVSFVSNGLIGVLQKVHQNSQYKDELNAFLIMAFVSAAVLCAIVSVFMKRKNMLDSATAEKPKFRWWAIVIMLLCGVGNAVVNKLNLYLSGAMDSAVFFPIFNGGGLVLATVAAVVLFKEKLTKLQWVGVVIGIVSVVFLCNPF